MNDMGMYTRLVLNVALSEKAESVIALVKAAVAGEEHPSLPGRLAWMLRSSSYYHDNIQAASFTHDAISKTWKLSVTCDLKNYEEEIEKFLALIAPAVQTDSCAGYYLYEESTAPTLFWFCASKVLTHTPNLPDSLFDAING